MNFRPMFKKPSGPVTSATYHVGGRVAVHSLPTRAVDPKPMTPVMGRPTKPMDDVRPANDRAGGRG